MHVWRRAEQTTQVFNWSTVKNLISHIKKQSLKNTNNGIYLLKGISAVTNGEVNYFAAHISSLYSKIDSYGCYFLWNTSSWSGSSDKFPCGKRETQNPLWGSETIPAVDLQLIYYSFLRLVQCAQCVKLSTTAKKVIMHGSTLHSHNAMCWLLETYRHAALQLAAIMQHDAACC